MKQIRQLVMFCLLAVSLAGCGVPVKKDASSQSVFWDTFSIGKIVEENSHFLIPEARQLFGSEAGPPEPFEQKQEEMMIQIEAANLPAFLAAIQAGIEETIISSSAAIVGRGSGGVTGTSYSISYQENETYGVVTIWGAQGEGTTYYLFAMVTEER